MTYNNAVTTLGEQIDKLSLGGVQLFGNIAVAPIFVTPKANVNYVTLTEALDAGTLAVTEKDQGGSVPELFVINESGKPVLLLDGEEVVGAKQNRVLNASILVAKHSELVVPVSCTERGRWEYTSQHFADSGLVAARDVRVRKNVSVAASVAADRGYGADQAGVWDEISDLQARTQVASPTCALRDVFVQHEDQMDACLRAFKLVPGQAGLLVSVDGEVIGFDFVSAADRYRMLHPKLVKSYVIGALNGGSGAGFDRKKAEEFVDHAREAGGAKAKSPGLGWGWRYQSAGIAGSVLAYRGCAVHAAFFAVNTQSGDAGRARESRYADTRLADYRTRRARRNEW